MKKIIVKGGRFKGKTFWLESEISKMGSFKTSCLVTINIDNYKIDDAPFYYGKIDNLGYIISGKHLGINYKNKKDN